MYAEWAGEGEGARARVMHVPAALAVQTSRLIRSFLHAKFMSFMCSQ